MHRFEVWAPFAKSIAVQVNGKKYPMQSVGDRGWWAADVNDVGAGSDHGYLDYGYLFDADPTAYPDPRSQCQPNGVHGLSRLYDQSAFQWSDAKFQPQP